MTEISARNLVENDRTDVPHLFGFVKIIPQTVLALRGSHGVGIEGAMDGGWIRSRWRSLIFVAIYSTW